MGVINKGGGTFFHGMANMPHDIDDFGAYL
jgi:hypothetical protein